MITDTIKPYFFEILITTSSTVNRGGCVIFKPSDNCKNHYLLTARHNFFSQDENSSYKENHFNTHDVIIEVFQEGKSLGNIDVFKEKAFFFNTFENDELLDIALVIIDSELNNILSTTIYDTTDENHSKHVFYTAGYPAYIQETDVKNTLQFYNINPISNYNNDIERVINTDGSVSFYDCEFPDKLKGMSGSGIFLLSKNGEVALRSIIYKAIPTNQFECVKIDEILDRINTILFNFKLESIKTNIKPLLSNDEVFSLEELADIKNIRNLITRNSKLNIDEIITADHIREKAKNLNKSYNNLNSEIESLSYQYAHLALRAHDENMQLAKQRFFKRAILLNPSHITAFSLEKSEYQKNKTAREIKEIVPNDVNGTYKKYSQLIDIEHSPENKITLLKEAITSICFFEKTIESEQLLNNLAGTLNNLYDKDQKTKITFKYRELAEFYHKIPSQYHNALYYNQLSLNIIELFANPNFHQEAILDIKNKINSLEKLGASLSNEVKKEIESKAKNIFSNEEDKTIKETLDKIYYEIFAMKLKNTEQKEISQEIIESLISLHIQNNQISTYTKEKNVDINTSNYNSIKIKDSAKAIEDFINKAPEKYEIQLDDKTRNELRDIIEEPVATINSTLEEINQTSKQTREHIDHSEKNLNHLVEDGLKQLTELAKQSKENLENISKYQSKLNNEKNELLIFIRRFEVRIKKSIDHLCDCYNERDTVIGLIQQSINNLAKQLKNLNFTKTDRADEKFYYIQQRNMASIQHSCLDLENKIIEKLEEIQQNRNGSTVETTEEKDNDLFIDLIKETQSFIKSNNQHLQKLINKESISIKTSQTKIQNDLNDIKNHIAHQSGKTENVIKTSIHDARQLLSKQMTSNNAKIDSAGNGVVNKILIHTKDDKNEIMSHLQNTDYKLQRINNTQLRFEKSLLEKTKEALDSQQHIDFSDNVRMPLSLTRKVLLGICITIFISAITYFIINYRLLDLPLDLWQTALQKINS